MLIKDQLRIRMEQLKISVAELSKRVGVSNQGVRHWLAGRSFPGKDLIPILERELQVKLDFSEGRSPPLAETVESSLQKSDVEAFLAISRLPPEIKHLIGKLAIAICELDDRGREAVIMATDLTNSTQGRRHSPRR